MSELPLFPLQTVLLPGGRLALRVFETRYLDMVARCLRATNRFGVIAIREGAEVGAATLYDYGTSAEIVDWDQGPEGMLGIVAAGREPFRLVASRRQADGLYVGTVEWLEGSAPQRLPAAYDPLAKLLGRLLESLPLYRDVAPAFDDAAWVGARLIEVLPLDLPFKQALLELDEPERRLVELAAALERSGGEWRAGS
jgi:Lon protease-like protein